MKLILVAYQKTEPGCVPEEGILVVYQKKRTWLRTRRRNPGCVPEEENLVAYQKTEPGCVPEERSLVAYQKRVDIGCIPIIY